MNVVKAPNNALSRVPRSLLCLISSPRTKEWALVSVFTVPLAQLITSKNSLWLYQALITYLKDSSHTEQEGTI
jgi:hypothetical protein